MRTLRHAVLRTLAAAGVLILLIAVRPAISFAAPPHYTIEDFGTLGGKESYAYGTNADGLAGGESWLAGGSTATHAFLRTTGKMQDLGTLASAKRAGFAARFQEEKNPDPAGTPYSGIDASARDQSPRPGHWRSADAPA